MFLKKCTKCGKEFPSNKTHFRLKRINSKSNRKGLNSKCRECEREYTREYTRINQPWKKKSVKAYIRKYRNDNADTIKNYELKRMYGIDIDEFRKMLTAQGGKCAICGIAHDEDGTGQLVKNGHKHFSIDHDHKSGEIRGILCAKCNRGVGHFKDDPALFQSAITYLKSFNKVSFEVSEIPEESRGQTMATN